jgi:hypothetical protein
MLGNAFEQTVETGRVVNGDFAHHLSVQADVGLSQGGNEAGIADASHAAGGAEPGDPQSSEFAFSIPSVAEREASAADIGFLGETVEMARCSALSAGLLEGLFHSAMMGDP